MEKICVNLENCYGINKLKHTFDFSIKNGCVIYASNGTMKTSFAKTFMDVSKGDTPCDKVYNRTSVFEINKLDNGTWNNVNADDIFVIESFKEDFDFNTISRLLVRKDLKNNYDKIFGDIQTTKNRLIKKIAILSKLKQSDVENAIVKDFSDSKCNFLDILVSLEHKINGNIEIPVQDIKYKIVFDDKILKFIGQDKIFDSIEEYSRKYMELIDKSEIFEKNVFTHNHAGNVGKDLDKNNFFDAKHQILLRNNQTIKTKGELEALIQEQKNNILSDDKLKEIFDEIDSGLDKNNDTRDFKKVIGNYPEIIVELKDIPEFKKKVWISILNSEKDAYFDLTNIYKSGKEELEKIISEAKKEESAWKDVVDLFNKRFIVPFEIKIVNQEDVVLKNEAPAVNFIYHDELDKKNMNKTELLGILSNGEKRALYLLNVIYEIEARKKEKNLVLIIADDIADSFDYQNKYAITEYLNDILKNDFFKLIILTHNFDFYRTVGSRLDNIIRENCHMVLKDENEIKIVGGQYLNNVFGYWKRQMNGKDVNECKRILIAAIPFVRNLIEYVNGKKEPYYDLLTNLLHLKSDSNSILLSDLQQVYSDVWNVNFNFDNNDTVFNLIFEEAECIIKDDINEVNLENKVALSIIIRLLAEDYMISQIVDQNKIKEINSYQTRKLYELFEAENNGHPALEYLEQVNLMTPENIHLNSFMYEPILDISNSHLINLYTNIKTINDARGSV